MEAHNYQLALYNYRYSIWRRKLIGLSYLLNVTKKSRKKFYIRNIYKRRQEQGFHTNLIAEMRLGDDEQYFNFHRMTPTKFDELLGYVGPLINKQSLSRNDIITPSQRLSITLRYLASGDSMASLTFAYRVSKSSISNIIRDTCKAIWDALYPIVFTEPTEETWTKISERFFQEWNFPNCVGAIDGKHVVVQAPDNGGSLYFNYKGTHSLVLMAVCDADYIFTLVDIGASGRQSDGGIFRNASFGQAIIQEKINLPHPKRIPGSENRVSPYLFVADAAFPMSNSLMRPYPQRGLSVSKRMFNYRLSRARRTIENAFGIMSARFRIFRKPIIGKLRNIEYVIQSCVCLHNYLRKGDRERPPIGRRYCPPKFVDRETCEGVQQDGEWRQWVGNDCALQTLGRVGANMYSRRSEETRNFLADYFMNEGQVAWQWKQAGLEEEG